MYKEIDLQTLQPKDIPFGNIGLVRQRFDTPHWREAGYIAQNRDRILEMAHSLIGLSAADTDLMNAAPFGVYPAFNGIMPDIRSFGYHQKDESLNGVRIADLVTNGFQETPGWAVFVSQGLQERSVVLFQDLIVHAPEGAFSSSGQGTTTDTVAAIFPEMARRHIANKRNTLLNLDSGWNPVKVTRQLQEQTIPMPQEAAEIAQMMSYTMKVIHPEAGMVQDPMTRVLLVTGAIATAQTYFMERAAQDSTLSEEILPVVELYINTGDTRERATIEAAVRQQRIETVGIKVAQDAIQALCAHGSPDVAEYFVTYHRRLWELANGYVSPPESAQVHRLPTSSEHAYQLTVAAD